MVYIASSRPLRAIEQDPAFKTKQNKKKIVRDGNDRGVSGVLERDGQPVRDSGSKHKRGLWDDSPGKDTCHRSLQPSSVPERTGRKKEPNP